MRAWLIALWLLCAPLYAAPVAPAYVGQELGAARLSGQGNYTWFGLKIYAAELWLGPQGYAADGVPLVLELRYARALNGARIADASAEQMAHIGAGSPAQRSAWLAQMKAIFPDVQDGTRLAGVLLPGQGVRFYRDGQLLATVPDPAFARAFFGIWLDPATSAPKLREALLRDAAMRP
jgi:hypothetical protein